MDEHAKWLLGALLTLVTLLGGGWGRHIMARLAEHDEKLEEMAERMTKAEEKRATKAEETAVALANINSKLTTLTEMVKAILKHREEES